MYHDISATMIGFIKTHTHACMNTHKLFAIVSENFCLNIIHIFYVMLIKFIYLFFSAVKVGVSPL